MPQPDAHSSGEDDLPPPRTADQRGPAGHGPVEIEVTAGRWRLYPVLDNASEVQFAAELILGRTNKIPGPPRWAIVEPNVLALEEALGWAIPHPAQNALIVAQFDLPLPPPPPSPANPLRDDVLRTFAFRPTRASAVHGLTSQPLTYGRLLAVEHPTRSWDPGPLTVDVFEATTLDTRAAVYRISDTTPGQPPTVLFADFLTAIPDGDTLTTDDAIRHVLLAVLHRAEHNGLTADQLAFLVDHKDLIATALTGPPDHPYPRGTRIAVHDGDPTHTTTGTVLAIVDDPTGPAYLWRPDTANLPGHPWRDHPTWTLRTTPHQTQTTLATTDPTIDGPDAPPVLATGALVATVDDPRFTTGTVLRALHENDASGPAYEIQPHDAPLPPVTLAPDDVIPLRGTAWPTIDTLLAARNTANLPLKPGELLLTLREITIVADNPDGPQLLATRPVPHTASPALDPPDDLVPIPVPTGLAHPASPHQPAGQNTPPATLHQTGDTIHIHDPIHGHLTAPADLFRAAIRLPETQLHALLARRPWLPAPTTDQPLYVTAALAAQHAATDLTGPRVHQPATSPDLANPASALTNDTPATSHAAPPDLPGPAPAWDPGP
ncbi:hypothetical protein [Frankia nepalensis]|uniref:Uncharacterized protein n=1 Tax=Frankia nepalensis TaxID=1836974 RepID=A0A937RDH8_9ACTN|nr:hypothetical protein [Frankia nepalensis]MBL7498312.1 hypothetical protein [Frankia nepalensis]MBL7512981.1 hypothetical protein [Frankia nepalensis]MBL7630141.1 hypothetical protein [Frankia nepalensis]